MFEKVLITDEERQMFPKWTVLDEDLADVDPVLAEQVLESRLEFFRGDISRTDYWHDPEGIDVIADIQYVDDGTRAHRLDLYLPHDSVVRGSKTTPVYIDIHGGDSFTVTRTSTATSARTLPSRDLPCFP